MEKFWLIIEIVAAIIICLIMSGFLAVWPCVIYIIHGMKACIIASIITLIMQILFIVSAHGYGDSFFVTYCCSAFATCMLSMMIIVSIDALWAAFVTYDAGLIICV